MELRLSLFSRVVAVFFLASFSVFLQAQPLSTETPGQAMDTKPNPSVLMETNLGEITIELFADRAPVSVANFLSYVRQGFYNGVIFHRVVPGFVVQGGGFDGDYRRKETGDPIENESKPTVKNRRGTLSMARLPHPDSATSQFFINLVDNRSLDWRPGQPGYAVFGEVVKGMEVVEQMASLPQGDHTGTFVNAPNEAVIIKSAKELSAGTE